MANCGCPEGYVLNESICEKTTVIVDVVCPEGCTTILLENGNAKCDCVDSVEPIYIDDTITVDLNDETKFKDVSWTIAYNPLLGSWLSYYDFKPNYYISNQDYFQTGINNSNDESEFGAWSHNLSNKSHGIYYGKKYPFVVEYVVKNENINKTLDSIGLYTEAKRYHNEFDYAVSPNITFNKSIIYNNNACSGTLNLVPQKNNFVGNKNYPKLESNGTQSILISNINNIQWSYNYVYDRVLNNISNQPILLQDSNMINFSVNTDIVKFGGKRLLERLNGDFFINRLFYDKDSRFSLSLKFTENEVDV